MDWFDVAGKYWGKESYVYASQALKKMGTRKMAGIVDRCQALVDKRLG